MKDIIIIGAGHGGIVAAARLAEQGYNITIFEKSNIEDIGYDFTDVFEIECFKKLNIDINEELFPKKEDMTFISPNLKNCLTPKIPEEYQEYRMERKKIYKYLLTLVKHQNIKIIDNEKIINFIIKNDVVIGVEDEEGKQYFGDLVIDSAGYVFEPRKNLPHNKNNNNLNKTGDFLFAYRATYTKNGDNLEKYKVYLYPIGIKGIAWVVCLDNEIDVLIGSVEKLTKEIIIEAMEFLRKENICLEKDKIRGGQIHKIPISKPKSCFFCQGYVAIGDSASMTIPLIGSGITNSIIAGEILADSIKKYGINLDAFWNYQYKYMIERGWEDVSLNCIKSLLLNLDVKSIDFLFDKKVIKANDLLTCCAGRELKLKPLDFISRGFRGIGNISLILKFAKAYQISRKAIKIVKRIPKVYNEIQVKKFIQKYEKL